LLKYSSMPSMKIAMGEFSARRRGTRWPSVSVAQRCSSLGVKSSRRTKWSITLCSWSSAPARRARADLAGRRSPSTCFSAGHRDRGEPDLRPRQRRGREERDRLAAEDLVADRLVEQVAARQAGREALALVEDALGLQQQRLAEALGADDDELVVAVRRQEAVDLGRAVAAATRRSPRRPGCRRRPRSTLASVLLALLIVESGEDRAFCAGPRPRP
jgi:hypothetical protein